MALPGEEQLHSRTLSGRVVSAAAALLFIILGAAFLGEYHAKRAFDWVAHTLIVQLEATTLLTLVDDLETGQRGYLLTGNDAYLEPYTAALPKIPASLQTLMALTEDNPAQQERVQRLERFIQSRIELLARNIDLRRTEGLEAIVGPMQADIGRNAMTRVRETIAEINSHEKILLDARKAEQARITLVVRATEVLGLLALILASLLALRQTRTTRAARHEAFEAQKQAVEAATAASRSKSDFLASMSHEIRTPLNAVIGNIELLARSGVTQEQEELLFDAEKAAKSLLALIGNVLDFSKIEAGKLTIEDVDMAPAALLQEAVDILQSRARQNNLFVTMSVGADVPLLVKGDPTRLRQILLNLLGNAVKFTLQGGVHARIEAFDRQQDRCQLGFHIHDSGKGFAQSIADTLFQPFTQDQRRAAENFEGTGLGLSISKNLVEAFGGTLSCESAPGDGASFQFTLPVQIIKHAPLPAPAKLDGRAVMFINGSGIQPPNLAQYFRDHGARIVEANTREAALALARGANGKHLLDVAIYVDHTGTPSHWPAISLATELRAHHTVFAIYTPQASPALWRRALGAGAGVVLEQDTTGPFLDRNIDQILGHGAHNGERATADDAAAMHDRALLTGKHVLVLEDRLVNQTVVQRQLKTLDMTCTIAADGLAGLEAIAAARFDLILCDCSMPRMNGYDFTRALRAREQDGGLPRTPVIAMTANAFREDMEKCFASGMDDFVSKPVGLDRLSAVLAHWLSKQDVAKQDVARQDVAKQDAAKKAP